MIFHILVAIGLALALPAVVGVVVVELTIRRKRRERHEMEELWGHRLAAQRAYQRFLDSSFSAVTPDSEAGRCDGLPH